MNTCKYIYRLAREKTLMQNRGCVSLIPYLSNTQYATFTLDMLAPNQYNDATDA